MRAGEELEVARVDAWLKDRVPGLSGAPEVTQYSGGASNWTYRLRYESHDLVLRRPPEGTKAKSAHDMGREYRIQKALGPVFPFVPEMIAFCDDPAVISCEFYVMRRLDGTILRKNPPRDLALTPDQTRRLCLNVIDTLIALHGVEVTAPGIENLGKGAGYARRQIEGWSDRYRKARTWNVPRFERVMTWLAEHTPEDTATCVIHNDFRFDNVVLDSRDPTRVIGVLDWEMATLGDPLMDLGNALAYWVQADDDFFIRSLRRQPTHLPGMLTRRGVVDYYAEKTGRRTAHWAFYEVYGLFRLAVIAQQIYYRYQQGQTRNPAFRNFWMFVTYLGWRCGRIIRRAGP
ncbi:MAG: phosphotransferase family protein [Vicinamibacteria bacterium]|nr:phosphotransferase family protein [Vicinamibacteria bacterium]